MAWALVPAGAQGAWIGLTDAAIEDAWAWADGSRTPYTNWALDQAGSAGPTATTPHGIASRWCPRSGGQGANKGGEWNDCSCTSEPRPYVCEAATAPLAPPKTASATTSVGVQQVHLTTYGETCSTAHRQRDVGSLTATDATTRASDCAAAAAALLGVDVAYDGPPQALPALPTHNFVHCDNGAFTKEGTESWSPSTCPKRPYGCFVEDYFMPGESTPHTYVLYNPQPLNNVGEDVDVAQRVAGSAAPEFRPNSKGDMYRAATGEATRASRTGPSATGSTLARRSLTSPTTRPAC